MRETMKEETESLSRQNALARVQLEGAGLQI